MIKLQTKRLKTTFSMLQTIAQMIRILKIININILTFYLSFKKPRCDTNFKLLQIQWF